MLINNVSNVNEYVAVDSGEICELSLCTVIVARLNASQRSRVGVGMNKSARG